MARRKITTALEARVFVAVMRFILNMAVEKGWLDDATYNKLMEVLEALD